MQAQRCCSPFLSLRARRLLHRAERLARIAELRLDRLGREGKSPNAAETLLNELNDIRGLLALDRVLFFQEYKIAAAANAAFAVILYGLLSLGSTRPRSECWSHFATCLIVLSAGPAVASLAHSMVEVANEYGLNRKEIGFLAKRYPQVLEAR